SSRKRLARWAGTSRCTRRRTTPRRSSVAATTARPTTSSRRSTTARAGCSPSTTSACADAKKRQRDVRKGTDMGLADIFEAVAGPDASVEFRAYDGSVAGTPGADVRITVRSPVAVSYLAQAPGALGLARAYVSGHLDVDGDMFTAL